MGAKPAGNGRRESYAHVPMPRMTNQLAGDKAREEIIGCLKRGLCTTTFGGGQVDITNGRFVFSTSEAYWVENGKIQYPVKEATIIGNDLALDSCVGLRGKEGQGVPVGVGHADAARRRIGGGRHGLKLGTAAVTKRQPARPRTRPRRCRAYQRHSPR